ncbi:MAG: hypothetical protein HQ478_16210 [Chloroflexi bacterium]|nr:hypothetical protein [Chloroflexota bacterium]
MDLIPLTAEQWGDGGNAIKLLWLSLLFAVTGSGSFVTAHALIPSAISTGHIPEKFSRLRIPLYVLGIIAVVAIAVNVVLIIGYLGYIEDVYSRRYR